ncbi:MAG: HlyD family efflux transporter periplasmic adaptor subunit [Peptococcaceae bacterium]|nr:HlyD family efflux transporter periplasmic adaptor subunit [Peptococcaceae bacterium]
MTAQIRNIREMTDSREMIESKPHALVSGFVYILLAVIAVAATWAYFGEIDDYFKAIGTVRPSDQIVAVRNSIAGRVESVFLEEGMRVSKGAILFTLETTTLRLEETRLTEQRQHTAQRLDNLGLLKRSITNGRSYFDRNNPNQADHYNIYCKYMTDRLVGLEQTQNLTNDIDYQLKENIISIRAIGEKSAAIAQEKANYELLKRSLEARENLFADVRGVFYGRFIDYIYKESLLENSIERLQQSHARLKAVIGNEMSTEKGLREAGRLVEMAEAELLKHQSDSQSTAIILQRSIKLREDEHIAALELYDEGMLSEKQLADAALLQWAQEDLARHGTNSALGQQALQKSLQYYNSELDSMRRLHEIGGNESQELKQLDIQLASARVELLKFKNDYLIGIDSTIEQNRLSLMELAATLEKAQAAVDAYQKRAETVTTTVLDKLRFDTLVSIYEQESAYQERMRDIDDKLKAVNLTMSEATVVAPTDGTVNIIADIAPGEVLNNSVEVATIVPDTDTEFKIVFDVSNKDISGVKPGQV